jgi:hypothetical protein
MMPVDRALLKQALSELIRLKASTDNPTRFLAQFYTSALEEWAEHLGVDPLKLNKLVLIKEVVPDRRLH